MSQPFFELGPSWSGQEVGDPFSVTSTYNPQNAQNFTQLLK